MIGFLLSAFATAGVVARFAAGWLRGLGLRHALARHVAHLRLCMNRHCWTNVCDRVLVLCRDGVGRAGVLFLH